MIIRSFFFFPLNMCELEKIQEPLLFHMIYISIEFKEEGSFISLYQLFFFFFLNLLYICVFFIWQHCHGSPSLWPSWGLEIPWWSLIIASHSMRNSSRLEYSPSLCQEHSYFSGFISGLPGSVRSLIGTIQRELVFFWTHLISEPKVLEA